MPPCRDSPFPPENVEAGRVFFASTSVIPRWTVPGIEKKRRFWCFGPLATNLIMSMLGVVFMSLQVHNDNAMATNHFSPSFFVRYDGAMTAMHT
jgi:hypothetical protein